MLFGTDGIRGLVNKEINCKIAYDIGKAVAIDIIKNKLYKKVLIGKDTRLSSDAYVSAVSSGLSDYGVNVTIVGVVSTPIVSFLVSRFDYSFGIMITASHNDYKYNGIKVFNQHGEKINKIKELELEKNIKSLKHKTIHKGLISINEQIVEHYINFILNTIQIDLSSMTIVIDCANGSNFKIAPYVYKKLMANVIPIFCENNGIKINYKCGANYIEKLVKEVKFHKADIGIAFDGDGDRLRIVLKNGQILSGEDILINMAHYLKLRNKLNNLMVAGTIMTNMGLEESLNNSGIKLIRSDVGDKNVIQLMKDNNLILGGEPSGHICILDYLPSCDALFNSLFLIKSCKEMNVSIENVSKNNNNFPSIMRNIDVDREYRKTFDNNIKLKNEINNMQTKNKDIRIVVRPSGTEPVIRIYVEGKSTDKIIEIANQIEDLIKNKA